MEPIRFTQKKRGNIMELLLNCEGFEQNEELVRNFNGGVQYVFKFENNYGASVVKHDYSYGHEDDLWELAVVQFDGDNWSLTYDTEITSDVLTRLTDEEVRGVLARIKEL
jgi:hypothetical protein